MLLDAFPPRFFGIIACGAYLLFSAAPPAGPRGLGNDSNRSSAAGERASGRTSFAVRMVNGAAR